MNRVNGAEMQDILLKPARIATSKPAQRTYLNTLLISIASTILLGIAVLAYATFYWNYIPQIGIERVVHLQYGDGPHPYGITNLHNDLVSQQQYDISLTLHVPRSPRNLDKGNFMVTVNLLRASYTPPPPPSQRTQPLIPISTPPSLTASLKKEDTTTTLRRAAILTYTSRLISLSERLLSLPLYLLGLKREAEILHIPLAELLTFDGRGRGNVPAYAIIEIEAGQEVQIYDVRISFTARFGGLRWWMYNHRIVSAVIGISTFWGCEVFFTLLGWLLVKSRFGSSSSRSPPKIKSMKEEVEEQEDDKEKNIKRESDLELSDTERTFPTYGRNKKPLKWERATSRSPGPDEIKLEPVNGDSLKVGGGGAVDADDEDEQLGGFMDSGIGTSYSEAGVSGSVSKGVGRRRSKHLKGGGAPDE